MAAWGEGRLLDDTRPWGAIAIKAGGFLIRGGAFGRRGLVTPADGGPGGRAIEPPQPGAGSPGLRTARGTVPAAPAAIGMRAAGGENPGLKPQRLFMVRRDPLRHPGLVQGAPGSRGRTVTGTGLCMGGTSAAEGPARDLPWEPTQQPQEMAETCPLGRLEMREGSQSTLAASHALSAWTGQAGNLPCKADGSYGHLALTKKLSEVLVFERLLSSAAASS
jgi:hypothetical protein